MWLEYPLLLLICLFIDCVFDLDFLEGNLNSTSETSLDVLESSSFDFIPGTFKRFIALFAVVASHRRCDSLTYLRFVYLISEYI